MGAMEFITRLRDWASRREAEEHSDPEIKPVEQDVEKYTEAEDECPDRHDVENQGIHDRGVPEAVGGVRTRRSGLPPSIGLWLVAKSTGPLLTSRAIIKAPPGKR